jgi:hypothetical protein
MQAATALPVDSIRLAFARRTMATQTTVRTCRLEVPSIERVARKGDPPLHYEHVDYESTCIDCKKAATRPWSASAR